MVKGRDKRFQLKLEAQKLLIQMRIEDNIRKVFPASTAEVPGRSS